MANVDDFFIEDNSVDLISEASYENINNIIDEIEAFSRLTYKSVYIIDYYKRNFLYVSKNPLFLCGLSPEEVKELGYNFYINNVPKEDLDFLLIRLYFQRVFAPSKDIIISPAVPLDGIEATQIANQISPDLVSFNGVI